MNWPMSETWNTIRNSPVLPGSDYRPTTVSDRSAHGWTTLNGYRGWDFWMQRRQIGMHLIHLWPDNALKVVGQNQMPADRWTHVAVRYDGSGKASGIRVFYDGQEQPVHVEADRLSDSIRTSVPLQDRSARHGSAVEWRHDAGSADLPACADRRRNREPCPHRWCRTPADEIQRSPNGSGKRSTVRLVAGGNRPVSYRQLCGDSWNLERERSDLQARGTIAHVSQERNEPAMAYVLFRGEYDKRRDPVTPDTPEMLPRMNADLPRNRLGFARWLLDENHPLTARVTVNRFWQEIFGRGLVATSGRFWRHRRTSVPPGIAGLAGRRVPRVRLGRQTDLQADAHVGNLPPVGTSHARQTSSSIPRTVSCREVHDSGWMPRWFATTPCPPAGCCRRRSVARA